MKYTFFCFFISLFLFSSCQNSEIQNKKDKEIELANSGKDWHTQSNAAEIPLSHLHLNILVDFDQKSIIGSATWILDTLHPASGSKPLYLDTRGLQIDSVLFDDQTQANFILEQEVPYLGRALRIDLKEKTKSVTIFYKTEQNSTALQWLSAHQTFGKNAPFLYTQSESIYARSWIPCPDGPGIRFTYDAIVKVPTGLMALMSAENPQEKSKDGVYYFKMKEAIPAYLMALAVGDLTFKKTDERTGVYSELDIIDKAHHEFENVGQMVNVAENLYGPYRWGRYDILVLPPGFPLGGMENPRLTFCTPSILAGDQSLVNLIAHELAHSWSGNLVTNATWEDFWLNEGFTVYFERRIMEAIHGKDYVDMLWELGMQDLKATIDDLGQDSRDTWLSLDLKSRDPDIGLTDVAYEKGSAFLKVIEETVGRKNFDQFLKEYFKTYAFHSITTVRFIDYLEKKMLNGHEDWKNTIRVKDWVYGPGIPDNYIKPDRKRFEKVEEEIQAFNDGKKANQLKTNFWSTYEWLHFLRNIPYPIELAKMNDLDQQFHLSQSQNSEIADLWYLQAIRSNYSTITPQIKNFLIHTGRMKFLEPLYKALMETPKGKQMAMEIYKTAKENYHPLAQKEVESILYPKK